MGVRAYLGRDREGFWVACIEEDRKPLENSGIGTVRKRRPLPVPRSATFSEARAAFRELIGSDEGEVAYGHR